MSTTKMPVWPAFVFALLFLSLGLYLLITETGEPSTGSLITIGVAMVIALLIFLAIKLKWFKKTITWKWSKIWSNGGMVAAIALFLSGAWFLLKKSDQTLQVTTEPYADIRANREQRSAEREALFTGDPLPQNFKLGEWAIYHKDSVYRFKKGLKVGLTYRAEGDPIVTFTNIDATKGDNQTGAEWYFRVDKTSKMIWSTKKE